jgi:hypothetical protein
MTTPIFIAANQISASVVLDQLTLTVPPLGTVVLSDYNKAYEIQSDNQLRDYVTNGTLLINDGTTTLSLTGSLQYLSTIVSYAAVGSPATTTTAGFMSAADKVILDKSVIGQRIRVAKSGGDYQSIKLAVDSITTASSTNQYIVEVYPGVYTEDPFTVPSYVTVQGVGSWYDCTVVTTNNSSNFISLSVAATLSHIAITGPTEAGFAAIDYTGTGYTPAMLENVVIKKGYYGVNVHPATYGTIHCHNVVNQYSGAVINQFFRVTNGNATLLNCSYMSGPSGSVVTGYYIVGSGARITLDNCGFRAPGSTDGVYVDNGGHARITAGAWSEGTNALHVGPTGTGSVLTAIALTISEFFTKDLLVETPTAIVSLNGAAHQNKIDIPIGTTFAGTIYDNTIGSAGTTVYGQFYLGVQGTEPFPIGTFAQAYTATGVYSGGGIERVSGLQVKVLSGSGLAVNSTNNLKVVTWPDTTLTLSSSQDQIYVSVDINGTVGASTIPVDLTHQIFMGRANTDTSSVRFLSSGQVDIPQQASRLYEYTTEVIGPINYTGGVVSQNSSGSLSFDVTSGEFYAHNIEKSFQSATSASFTYWYRSGSLWKTSTASSIDNLRYDAGTNTLVNITSGSYKRDILYVSTNSTTTDYHVVYGQQLFSSSVEAVINPNPPDFMNDSSCRLAALIIKSGSTSFSSIEDQRPKLGQQAAATSGVTVHGNLAGLSSNDHPQYQLYSEKGIALGYVGLNSSAQVAISNLPFTSTPPTQVTKAAASLGTLNEIALADHKHDVLTAAPLSLGTSLLEGVSSSLARSDHRHTHGVQTDPTHHSLATPGSAGFLSSDDKTFLDTISSGIETIVISVKNNYGAQLLKGRAITLNGVSGSTHLAVYADKDDPNLRPAFGVLQEDVPIGGLTKVIVAGHIIGLDTSAWTITDQLVLGNNGFLVRPPPENLSFTTGKIQTIAFVGSSDPVNGHISIHIDGLNVITAPQVFALSGTSGTPSSTNKYVTDSDSRNSNDRVSGILRSNSGLIYISGSAAPAAGQILTALNSTSASWTDKTLPSSTVPVTLIVGTSTAGTGSTVSRSDHQHNILTAIVSSITPNDVNTIGTSSSLSRSDHIHGITVADPVSIGTANSVGSLSSFSRSDHVHAHGIQSNQTLHTTASVSLHGFMSATDKTRIDVMGILTSTAPVTVTKAAAVVGTSNEVARQDHKHDISTAVATGLTVGGSNAEGSATSIARSDHTHSLPAFGTTVGTFAQGNDFRLNSDRTASDLRTATTSVNISSASAPSANQSLVAISSTVATWRNIVTGSDSWVQFNNLGQLGADINLKFDKTNKSLIVGNATATVNAAANLAGNVDDYVQVTLTNQNSGSFASSDFVVNSSNFTETSNYADFGINSPGYNDTSFSIAAAGDAYLYSSDTNLAVGTAATGKSVKFFTGGTISSSLRATVHSGGIDLPSGLNYSVSGTNLILNSDVRLTNDRTAGTLRTATSIVHISASSAPLSGQILTATSANQALWSTLNFVGDTVPMTLVVGTQTAGTGSSASRTDHRHNISTGIAVDTGLTNSEGVATSLSRSDHVHKARPVAQEVVGTSTITTTSTGGTLMTGMTITPAAGTYLVWFTGNIYSNNSSW